MIKIIESKEQWENFVEKFAPHTFLQSWEWAEAQALLNQKTFRLGIFENDNLVGVAFVYKITAKRGVFLFCPHGPLIDWSKQNLFEEFIKYLIELGKKEKVDFIRIAPLAPKGVGELFQKLNFRNAPVHMMHPELAWLLDITVPEEELLKNMEKRTRYSIKKAQKDGVEVKASNKIEDIELFYNIYQETAQRQKFVPFSKNYVKKEFEIFIKENKALLFTAYYQNEPIATAVIVFDNNSAFYHHGASIRKYNNITASELLQWVAIKEAKSRGLRFYNFWGVAPEGIKNHPWQGLSKFKTGFGGFSEEYLHCQDLKLTNKYYLNYFIEKTRRIMKRY